jgi:hypothetical protein
MRDVSDKLLTSAEAQLQRQWSGSDIPWLMRAQPPDLPEAPKREGNDDAHKRGQLPWINKVKGMAQFQVGSMRRKPHTTFT